MTSTFFWVAFAATFLPFVFVAIDYAFQPSYVTHKTGVVVISGASTGIGRHLAEYLTNTTNFVVFAGVRKKEDFENISAMKIPNLLPLELDVTSHDSCLKAIQDVKKIMLSRNLPLVGIVNNAGISRRIAFELHDLDDIKNLFNTNLFGTIDLTQQSLPLLRESKGRIVMISSVAGKIGRANGAAYSGSKFAMEAMSDSLRREVSSMGISVSIIEPAFVRTPILDKAMDDVFENRSDRADDVKMLYSKYSTPEAKEKAMKVLAYADEPIVTSEAIRHALTSPNPSTRYAVANFAGIPAYLIVFVLPFIPDRVLDFFLS